MNPQVKFVQAKTTTLQAPITSTEVLLIPLQQLEDIYGNTLTMADFGDIMYITHDPGTDNEEIVSATDFTVNDDGSVAIDTGIVRGLKAVSPYGAGGTARSHSAGSIVIISNNPQLYNSLVSKSGDENVNGKKTFSIVPASTADPVAGDDLTRKSYVDALVLGTLTTINVIVPAKAGATIAIGNLIYFDDSTNKWKLADADVASTVNNVLLAIAQGAGTDGNPITGGVLLQGVDDNQSGLLEGDVEYASNTAGGISATPGTIEVTVGIAKSATELYFNPRFNQQITEDQQDALAGSSGTPSATNKYVTEDDVSSTAVSGKIVRADAGFLPALDATLLTHISISRAFPRGETVNGATTPVPVVLIDDTFQEEFIAGQDADIGKVTTGNKTAFGFKLQGGITLTQLKVYLKKASAPTDNLVFTIQTDTAGAPSGTPVTNGTASSISGPGLTTSYVLTTVTFGGTVTLSANTQYWLVATRDSTTSDTNYYRINGIADATKYASFTGSTFNASSWSTGAVVPYVQLIATNGNSTSVWRCDTDHANYHMRFGVGLVNTDGAISASAVVIFRGMMSGFTGLVPMSIYYAQDTIGTIGLTAGTTEVIVGTAVSPTEIIVGMGIERPQYIGSMSLSSGANTITNYGLLKFRFFVGNFGASATIAQAMIFKTGASSAESSSINGGSPDFKQGCSVSLSGNTITMSLTGNSIAVNATTVYFYR